MKYLFAFALLPVLLTGCKHVFHIGEPLDGPGMVYTPPTDTLSEDSMGRQEPHNGNNSSKTIEQ
ncbi:MAG: hypothetical protein IKQ62_03945 [Bacteroidaceae bacterium]|nr:hypothetical protein [Bacteroidaceae bacterium]